MLKVGVERKNSKLCFILACHDKIVETLAHLDILKYNPIVQGIIVIHSGHHYLGNNIYNYPYFKVPPVGYGVGAFLALVKGLREAKKLNYTHAHFSNGDDWMLNTTLSEETYKKLFMHYKACGYNWLSYNCYADIALNEFFVDLSVFSDPVLEEYEKNASRGQMPGGACEVALVKLLERSGVTHERFYHIPGREMQVHMGVGYQAGFQNLNNRWFNEEWQLIGSHHQEWRKRYYNKIRNSIPYHEELEKERFFGGWFTH
jgi:hypothetical protein